MEFCSTNGLQIDPIKINLNRPTVKVVKVQKVGPSSQSSAKGRHEIDDPITPEDVDPLRKEVIDRDGDCAARESGQDESSGCTCYPRCCVALGCYNCRAQNSQRGVEFYLFPKDQERRKQWILKVNRRMANGDLWQPRQSMS